MFKRHGGERQGKVRAEKMNVSEPLNKRRKKQAMSKPESGRDLRDKPDRNVLTGRAASGVEAA